MPVHARLRIQSAHFVLVALVLSLPPFCVGATTGAAVPWTTYEAENMTVSGGLVLGPEYGPNVVASESSGRRCVGLVGTGQYVQFSSQATANAIVVRYSVPDTADGAGTNYTLSLYTNGVFAEKLALTSRYSWLYGEYPFTNDPMAGSPRNFYDEVHTNGLVINPGDLVRLQKDSSDVATSYVIDLVDLENVAAPLAQPSNSLSIMSFGAGGRGTTDDTAALNTCISQAISQDKSVWLPAGNYKITSAIYLPSNLAIQGAGMWYTALTGDPVLYTNSSRRVALEGNGSNIHLADFALVGKLNYRNDSEPNDGLVGAYGTGSSISRIWVEHTKTGAWLVNSSGLVVDSCRFRDTIADGINLCVGMLNTTVTNCTARGTGDDCFPIWPAAYTSQSYTPGGNVITHCTGQTPFLANGGALYGAAGNRIEDCQFLDITYGCGILLSTTFPIGTNIFSGATVVQRCDLIRCGGYDPGYQWRAALQFCLDTYTNGITGVALDNVNLTNSISDGLSVIGGTGRLANTVASDVNIPNYGLGVPNRNALWARNDAVGSMTVSNSAIAECQDDSTAFTFLFVQPAEPPSQNILGASVSGGGLAVTIIYATTPGYSYHVVATTNLATPVWAAIPGSATNAQGSSVTFSVPASTTGVPYFYRTVSP
ncbi:MAG TPA: glycosyl hydrolase family 28-related protein [Candidatus Acidoferrales bacterium]|nr:glycosyl hydrolase family 28-related protein [Candidatus Acidoferrales bacterium]